MSSIILIPIYLSLAKEFSAIKLYYTAIKKKQSLYNCTIIYCYTFDEEKCY